MDMPVDRTKTILVVENEEGMLEVASEILGRVGAYRVVGVQDPLEASRRLEAGEPFDLVVTNLNMPGLNGLKLLRLAKELDPERPVIVVTGYPMAETAERCRALGAAAYLRKPFQPDELERAVSAALIQASSS